jgi:hypothetical protein
MRPHPEWFSAWRTVLSRTRVLDHPSFTAPNVTATKGSFGPITTRALQSGVRLA